MRPEETDFERSMKQFGLLISRTVFFLVLFILVVRVAMHRARIRIFRLRRRACRRIDARISADDFFGHARAGAVRMARKQVVVKHLPAIQNFGTIDILCSDKTGTLTTGQMTLNSSVDYLGKPTDKPLALAYINSKFETGIRSPLDVAILKIDRPDAEAYVKRDEIPFDFDRRRLSVVVEKKNDSAAKHLLITKGAPEGILRRLQFVRGGRPRDSTRSRRATSLPEDFRRSEQPGFSPARRGLPRNRATRALHEGR